MTAISHAFRRHLLPDPRAARTPVQCAARPLGCRAMRHRANAGWATRAYQGVVLAAALLLAGACQRQPAADVPARSSETPQRVFRVVRAKQLTGLSVLEKQGSLERALAPL